MTLILPSVARRSRFDVDWRANECLANADHALTAFSGQAATHTRAAATTALDGNGVSYAVAKGRAAFEWCDLDGDTVRETPGVLLSTSDVLYLVHNGVPQAVSYTHLTLPTNREV